MRFHGQYCEVCKSRKLFLEKLTNPKDPNCTTIEDICMSCKNAFHIKDKEPKLKIKL